MDNNIRTCYNCEHQSVCFAAKLILKDIPSNLMVSLDARKETDTIKGREGYFYSLPVALAENCEVYKNKY